MDQKLPELVEELTTSGEPQLNPEKMKELKKICKYVFRFSISWLLTGPSEPSDTYCEYDVNDVNLGYIAVFKACNAWLRRAVIFWGYGLGAVRENTGQSFPIEASD
jgi:hypothetical protein